MKLHKLLCIIAYIFYYFISQTLCIQCPELTIQNTAQARSLIVEGISIYNSTIRFLRGAQELGSIEQINNLMVWDSSTNHCLKLFDLDLQISQMFYSKTKRKIFVAGTNKILEIHPLSFKVLNEHNIGGTTVSDIEYSESQILISKDYGNPLIYDIYLKQIVESLPYIFQNIEGTQWSSIQTLKDFTLIIIGQCIIIDKNNNYKFVAYQGVASSTNRVRTCSFKNQNLLITSNYDDIIKLGLLSKDQQGATQYILQDVYQEIYQTSSPIDIRAQNLYCEQKGNDYYVIFPIARRDVLQIVYKGATVLKINKTINPDTQQVSYKFSLQEKWKYRRWRKDMEYFIYDEAQQRGQSISQYEHYSYEFLESDVGQCDFDDDGQLDSYCRMAKTISHWPLNVNIGIYFLGQNSEYFFYANEDQKGYQIRDWNSTEFIRFKVPRLINKDIFSIRRVIQHEKSSYKLPYDTYILKMCWNYNFYPEMKDGHNFNAGFYVYKHNNFDDRSIDTYNLIEFMNPQENTEKYKNSFILNSAFTYRSELHICLSYTVLEINQNQNGDIIDNKKSYQYFSNHNKECYKLQNGNVVNFYQLKLKNPIVYGQGIAQCTSCTPFFQDGQLICRNSKPMLEFWSLDSYSLVKTFDTPGCNGDDDIAIHRNRFYIGCVSSIIIYYTTTQKTTDFIKFDNKVLKYIIIVEDILGIFFSNMEIQIYDLRPKDGSAILILNYLDLHDCCEIYGVDIHPVTKRLMWVSQVQINKIDLTPCLEDPKNCLLCEINAYFSYDPNFSFLKQKYERSSWSTVQPQFYVNAKFLDSGQGTIDNPFLSDMNIIQLYYKTHLYKSNIVNFNQITLNVYIDINKPQYMSNHLVDWIHDKTAVNFKPWDGTQNPTDKTGSKIKIVINSSKFFDLSFNNLGSLDITNLNIICPNCKSNSLTFQNSGEIYLRNSIVSLNLQDLIEPSLGQPDTRVFPYIRISVQNVKKFVLENQQVQNVWTDDLNIIPFFNFINCKEVNLKNILFQNITNKESIFWSEDSNINLENIVFTQINTCLETKTKRQKFSFIPFQNLVANNIKFYDNQFCDLCLFQRLVSSNSILEDKLIKISNITVSNNKFYQLFNSNILFLKISLASLVFSTQAIEVYSIKFEKNQGQVIQQKKCFYFELAKLFTIFIQSIEIVDEELTGVGLFSRLLKLEMYNINVINSQYLPDSNVQGDDRKKLRFKQNLILIQDIENIIFQNFKIIGLETQGIMAIQIEENSVTDLKNFKVLECSFIDSLFFAIQNLNSKTSTISITDSIFQNINLQTQESHIQVGILWVKPEKAIATVKLRNNIFNNNYLQVNQNTQKKSSISFSIDNSISNLTIEDCSFSNQIASSMIGDLFLNVQSLNIINSHFTQIHRNLLNTINVPFESPEYIKAIQNQMERTTIRGAFMQVQARSINITKSSFQNAISSEGAIQIFPNNNDLNIQLDECIFSNLYSSRTGTALFVSSITSPISINIRNCYFKNLWSGSLQKYDKAHLYFESNSQNKNKITLKNLNVNNIGVFSPENPLASSFLYQTGFTMSLSSSIIKQQNQRRRLNQDQILENYDYYSHDKLNIKSYFYDLKQKHILYQKQTKIQQVYENKNRLLSQNSQSLFEILKDQKFYGSCLIHSIQGDIQLNDLDIEGSALINDQYICQTDQIFQANILKAVKCQVTVNNLKLFNMQANPNGGIITILDSQLSTFTNIQIENIQINENQVQKDTELLGDIGSAKSLINCLKTDCSFTNFQSICQKNSQKCKGRILNLQEGKFNIDNSLFQDYQLDKQNGTAIFVFNPKNQFNISKSKFNGLQTQSCGAGIYLFQNNPQIQSVLVISENSFQNNTALNYGGAVSLESLFIQSQEKLKLINNNFFNNTAKISGAIYYSSYFLNPLFIQLNKFNKNNAQMGNDLYSKPSQINLIFENNNSSEIQVVNQEDTIMTIKHGSGFQIPKFIVNLFYLDSEGKEVKSNEALLPKQKEILQIDMSFDMKNPLKQSEQNKESDYYITGNLQSQYDQDKNQIYFQNVELYGKEGTFIYLIITSPEIKNIEIFDKLGNIDYEPYRFIIKVIFRECSKFEIVTTHTISILSPGTKKCSVCPDLSYSRDQEACEQCPFGATCKQGEELIVLPGYWRESYDTYSIILCEEDFEGCIGGQTVQDNLCLEGYIGPMCQECDSFDRRGHGRFSHISKQLCRSCSFGFVGVIVILLMTGMSAFLTMRSIKSNISFLKGKILIKFLKTIKFRRIRKIERLKNNQILIQMLMTYFQLIGIIRTVNIKIPNFLPEMSFYAGSPATSSFLNANCFMPEYLGQMHFIYYSFFLSLLVPFIHFLVLIIILKIKCKLEKEKLSICELKAGMIFLFNYFQPEFIYSAIQIITCKDIDKKSYNQANLSIECDHFTSYTIIFTLIIIFLGIIVPMILYKGLTSLHNDETFKDSAVQLKYSHYAFLCTNYKHHIYYWEFIRMAERLAFILVASIFNSRQTLKITILIFTTQGYNFLLKIKKPFKNNHFNKLEVLMNNIISTSLVLAMSIHNKDLGQTLDNIFFVIFILINLIMVSYIILLIVQETIYKIIDILMPIAHRSLLATKLVGLFIKFLDKIPIFKLTFDMKVFINKKRKSVLYSKIRKILLQLLEINPQDRNLLFLSLKERRNQSRYVSLMMSQIQDQFQTNKINILQSQNSPQNFSLQLSKTTQAFDKNEQSNSRNIFKKQLSNFKMIDKEKLEKIDENPTIQNKLTNRHFSIFYEDETSSPKTRNNSYFEGSPEGGVLPIQKLTQSQDIVAFDKNGSSSSLNKFEKQFSIFKTIQEKEKQEIIDENLEIKNQLSNRLFSQNPIFSEDELFSPKSDAKTGNTSFLEGTTERGALTIQKQIQSQDQLDSIQSVKRESVHQLFKDKGIKVKK